MILRFLVKYMISDFLIDQMEELKKYHTMLERKDLTAKKRAEIKRMQAYLYNQGITAINRYSREVPDCVKSYYLGNKPKPSVSKISKELSEISVHYSKINYKLAYIIVALLVTGLFLFALATL